MRPALDALAKSRCHQRALLRRNPRSRRILPENCSAKRLGNKFHTLVAERFGREGLSGQRAEPTHLTCAQAGDHLPDRAALGKELGRLRPRDSKFTNSGCNRSRDALARHSDREWPVGSAVEPVKVPDYAITFHDFPGLQPIRPFSGWTKTDPTNTLGWYKACNGIKHNREGEFERGTLRHAFEAVSACIALQVGQFGPTALNSELLSLVDPKGPDWAIREMYLPLMTSPTGGQSVTRTFSSSGR